MNDRYADLARALADALMRYARERDGGSKTAVGELQHLLCQLRREELNEVLSEDTDD